MLDLGLASAEELGLVSGSDSEWGLGLELALASAEELGLVSGSDSELGLELALGLVSGLASALRWAKLSAMDSAKALASGKTSRKP